MPVAAAKQLSIFLKNEPGVLAKLCRTLAREKISLKAISVSDSVDHAVVRLVVDRPAAARRLFEEHNLLVLEAPVIAVTIPDQPGTLARVAGRLGKAKLNVDYLYGSASLTDDHGTLYLRVNAPVGRVLKLLKGL